MGRGTPQGGRGAARNNNNNYGPTRGGGNRNKLDVSALGLVSPLGGAGLGALSALHHTVGVGGLGGLQQTPQLGGLLGGGTALAGGVSNELAGLVALLGGSQSHDVTLTAMQVLQVQQAMAAQAAAKQLEAETALQARIDAEVEKRTSGLVVKPPLPLVKPKPKTVKIADEAPEEISDDGVSQASGASKGAKRRRRHAERAQEMAGLSNRCHVLEEAFEKVVKAASSKKTCGYASEDDTRPNKSPDSELRSVVLAVQRGLREKNTAVEPKKKDDLAKKVCALFDDAGPYTPAKPRRNPRRASPASVGSMASGVPAPVSIGGSSSRKSVSKALSVDFGDNHAMENMRKRIAVRKAQREDERKKQVPEGAKGSQSTRGGSSKEAKKATTDEVGRKLTRLIDRALRDIPEEAEEVAEPKSSDCEALRPLALKIAKVYKPCALVVKRTELMEGLADTHGIRCKRKEDIVDWLVRVLYRLEYYDHGLLTYAGVVALLEKHE